MKIEIQIRTVSETNQREHWSSRHRRRSQQRGLARLRLSAEKLPSLPATVILTRLAQRKLDDDNLRGALKSIRDGVADAYNVDDGSDDFNWQYNQLKSKEYGVRIEIKRL